VAGGPVTETVEGCVRAEVELEVLLQAGIGLPNGQRQAYQPKMG
jgi:hypothetical protein